MYFEPLLFEAKTGLVFSLLCFYGLFCILHIAFTFFLFLIAHCLCLNPLLLLAAIFIIIIIIKGSSHEVARSLIVIDRVKLSAAPGRTVHTLFAKLCTMVEGHVKRSRTKARSDWSKGGAIALH